MKITVNVSKKDLKHLLPTHTFYDCCGCVESIMLKIQKEARRQFALNVEERE